MKKKNKIAPPSKKDQELVPLSEQARIAKAYYEYWSLAQKTSNAQKNYLAEKVYNRNTKELSKELKIPREELDGAFGGDKVRLRDLFNKRAKASSDFQSELIGAGISATLSSGAAYLSLTEEGNLFSLALIGSLISVAIGGSAFASYKQKKKLIRNSAKKLLTFVKKDNSLLLNNLYRGYR